MGRPKRREYLRLATMTYRLIPQYSTGFSPFRMLYGREAIISTEIRTITFIPHLKYRNAVQEHALKMDQLFSIARTKAQEVCDI